MVSITLLCFPAKEVWIILSTDEPIKVNSLVEFSYYCDAYENGGDKKKQLLLSSFRDSQIPTLEYFQKKVHGIRWRYNKLNQNSIQ